MSKEALISEACNLYREKTKELNMPLKLTFNGQTLNPNLSLSQAGLQDNSIIQVELD